MSEREDIIPWNGLPCLLDGDKAVLFSYVGDTLVSSMVDASSLQSSELHTLASENHLFDCLNSSNILVDVPVKQVTLCLTERCNCRCKYCFLDAYVRKNDTECY